MRLRKAIGAIGVVTPFWFLAVYLIMAGLRPDYSYLTKAISELGSVYAPHRWLWNILGYVMPGLAIALLGVELKAEFSDTGRLTWIPAFALSASGLFMMLGGIFPGNFIHRAAPTMVMHTIGSLGSYAAFLIAGFWLPFLFRRHRNWRWLGWPSLALVLCTFPLGSLERGHTPGLGQRLVFTCYFLWIGIVGYALMRSARTGAGSQRLRSAKETALP